MKHADYDKTYERGFFQRADGYSNWQAKQMRCGDALCVVGYALGIPSYERVKELVGWENDRAVFGSLDAKDQLLCLTPSGTRKPKSVLDIGGGRGEVAMAFAWLCVPVQVVEPHVEAEWFLAQTANRLYDLSGAVPLCKLIKSPCPECLDLLELDTVDTVTMVESLEHIPEDCFAPVWEQVKKALLKNKGRLIVANWLDYHPLGVSGAEHCRRVDDSTYDWLAEDGQVAYRNGSHLVVDY